MPVRVPRAGDAVGIGERQDVLAVLVVAGDLDGGAGEVRVVHVVGQSVAVMAVAGSFSV